MTTATATWKKLRNGDWGILAPAGAISPGAPVSVTSRNGSEKTVIVDRVLWSGDGKVIATVRDGHKTSRPTSPRRRRYEADHEDCLSFVGGCGPTCPYNFR